MIEKNNHLICNLNPFPVHYFKTPSLAGLKYSLVYMSV